MNTTLSTVGLEVFFYENILECNERYFQVHESTQLILSPDKWIKKWQNFLMIRGKFILLSIIPENDTYIRKNKKLLFPYNSFGNIILICRNLALTNKKFNEKLPNLTSFDFDASLMVDIRLFFIIIDRHKYKNFKWKRNESNKTMFRFSVHALNCIFDFSISIQGNIIFYFWHFVSNQLEEK